MGLPHQPLLGTEEKEQGLLRRRRSALYAIPAPYQAAGTFGSHSGHGTAACGDEARKDMAVCCPLRDGSISPTLEGQHFLCLCDHPKPEAACTKPYVHHE